MIKHKYFGDVIQDEWDESYSTMVVNIPHFKDSFKIKLVEYDEDFEPIQQPLNEKILDSYAETVKEFIKNVDNIVEDIQKSAFEFYLKVYAKYYEKPFKVLWENQKIKTSQNHELHKPLQIDTKEKHFEYKNSVLEKIIISNNKTIVNPYHYDIDEEHGIEIKIRNNKVIKVDGIGETTYE